MSDFLGVAPWVVVSSLITWSGTAIVFRESRRKRTAEREREHEEQQNRLEIHRDDLTFELLQNARAEMQAVRTEVNDLREETKRLRAMENHFFHFQQSLDHLEALLSANSPEELAGAQRNARAFLNRMRRLNEAKGTITNEVQRAASEVSLLDRNNNPVVGGNEDGTE